MLLMLLMPLIALSVVIFCFLIADCTVIILFQWSLQCVHSSLQSEVLLKVPLNEVP